MRYMLLIYSNPTRWEHPTFLHEPGAVSEAERARRTDQFESLMGELVETGELIGIDPLADPAQTRTVTARNGVEMSTDGPFVESKEHLAGYLLIECDTVERAVGVAARIPNAEYAAIEVRPVMRMAGLEM